jgi:hypothetical protein
MNVLHKSTGILRYTSNKDSFYRLALEVDQELSNYYRSLIPKWVDVSRPRWPAHITIVRPEKETPIHLDSWGKYEGEELDFLYAPEVQQGKIYFWLNAFCQKLENIRLELGLPVRSEYTLPPEGFKKCFHITIGNCK